MRTSLLRVCALVALGLLVAGGAVFGVRSTLRGSDPAAPRVATNAEGIIPKGVDLRPLPLPACSAFDRSQAAAVLGEEVHLDGQGIRRCTWASDSGGWVIFEGFRPKATAVSPGTPIGGLGYPATMATDGELVVDVPDWVLSFKLRRADDAEPNADQRVVLIGQARVTIDRFLHP